MPSSVSIVVPGATKKNRNFLCFFRVLLSQLDYSVFGTRTLCGHYMTPQENNSTLLNGDISGLHLSSGGTSRVDTGDLQNLYSTFKVDEPQISVVHPVRRSNADSRHCKVGWESAVGLFRTISHCKLFL